jgi:aspartyl-tRNA(Asn)/glutamyl-tRNA(Gln) amidotransferase subunit A
MFASHVPERSAETVARLEAAGYATVGKANLHEFAYGTTSENPHFGTVPNPAAPGRIAGGSSGGSAAALAAGLADAALGTDSGGSIRIPSACCGTVGLKPTYGLVSLEGCFPLAPSFDHAGPMARDVGGCARMLEALVPDFERQSVDDLADVRLGFAWLDEADPLVRRRVSEAAVRFPHRRALDFPRPDDDYALFMREVADVHRPLFPEHADEYGDDVRAKLERCLEVSLEEAEGAARRRAAYRERALEATAEVDLLLTPTLPGVAPRVGIGDGALREQLIRFTYPFNSLGWPALSLPCGPAEDGLQASAQLIGKPGEDALVLAAGALLEAALSLERGTPAPR